MLCIGYAKSLADEGFGSAERDPSPTFASRRHPLPQGEREDAALCAVAANQIETAPPADHETRFMTDVPNISPLDQARILSEVLTHMEEYDEETIVIKYGGHAMGAEETAKAFARDIVLLEQTAINPVVVHGGGPQIATMLKRLGIQSEFAAGLRITDAATIEIVEMVLAGSVNKQLVGYINEAGGKAVGLSVNADTFAGAVAGALKAKRLLLLTDVPGVLDKSRKLISELSVKDARKLIADGTISGGMIPKVETCIYALEQGVQGVVIIDGKMQHAVLIELCPNQGTGTLIHG